MSEILCPKCSANQVIANKDGGKIKITCLVCGHEFKPGQGATSMQDFKNKKKLEKQAGIGCAILILIVIIIVLISKIYTNYSNSRQLAKEKSIFQIDNSKLASDPINYLDRKRMEISVGYYNRNKKNSNIQENRKYVKEVIKFDSLVISNLNGVIEGIGYLTFNIPVTNNPNKQMDVFVKNNDKTEINWDYNKVIFYQERFLDQFKGITPNSEMYNQIKEMQHKKVKFKAQMYNFNAIDAKIKELEKGDKVVDDELLLTVYKDFIKDRTYRVEFKSIEIITE